MQRIKSLIEQIYPRKEWWWWLIQNYKILEHLKGQWKPIIHLDFSNLKSQPSLIEILDLWHSLVDSLDRILIEIITMLKRCWISLID